MFSSLKASGKQITVAAATVTAAAATVTAAAATAAATVVGGWRLAADGRDLISATDIVRLIRAEQISCTATAPRPAATVEATVTTFMYYVDSFARQGSDHRATP